MRTSAERLRWTSLLITLAFGAFYTATTLRQSWVPMDEGTLGQSAMRVLAGELPHRDFDDVYTGLLSLVNAAALNIFGASGLSFRIVLWLVHLLYIPALWWILSRFLPPVWDAVAACVAVAWGLPNYPAAMPSWYNLFFAVFALAALFKFIDSSESPGRASSQRRWLIVAGACCGISILFKIVGLYALAAVLLSLLFPAWQHDDAALLAIHDGRLKTRSFLTGMFLSLPGVVVSLLVFVLIHKRAMPGELYAFVLPIAALAGFLAIYVFRALLRGGHSPSLMAIAKDWLAVLAGAALPIALFLVPYIASHSLRGSLIDTFITPAGRLTRTFFPMPPLDSGLPALFLVSAMALAAISRKRFGIWFGAILGGMGATALFFAASREDFYKTIWNSWFMALPLIVVAALCLLGWRMRSSKIGPAKTRAMFASLMMAAMASLIQFPSSYLNYSFYIAGLIVIAASTLIDLAEMPQAALYAPVAAILLVFSMALLQPSEFYARGHYYLPARLAPVTIPADQGIMANEHEGAIYRDLVAVVQRHASGEYIYCSPDCPELYFFTGKKNPTRTFFDFFDRDILTRQRDRRILEALAQHDVNLVVINHQRTFSPRFSPALYATLQHEYPHGAGFEWFEVRWK